MAKNTETKGWLSDVEGDIHAGFGGLPTQAEDGAPEDNKYLFEIVDAEVAFSKSEKNMGVAYLTGQATVVEPSDFDGVATRLMIWAPVEPGDDASTSEVRKYDAGSKRFVGAVKAILGDDAFDGLSDDRNDSMHVLAEMLEGARFVGQMKKGRGDDARSELGDVLPASEWVGTEDDLPF